MPYHPDINDQTMLANIASIELPPVIVTLSAWLHSQPDSELERMSIVRPLINDREFYPRIILGEYFRAQFLEVVQLAESRGHIIEVMAGCRVTDIKLEKNWIEIEAVSRQGDSNIYNVDHAVMATGHNWLETTEVTPGYFISPWPAPILKKIHNVPVGILGTSLSAIDAMMTVATGHGAFYRNVQGILEYEPFPNTESLTITLMSRKGVLPEADFYCPIPYEPTAICTGAAVAALIEKGPINLLNGVFDLFVKELYNSDPEYAAKIGISLLTVETFAKAYFSEREGSDPFTWAVKNLAEAVENKRLGHTVNWRYAILRMHEVIAQAVPYFNEVDLGRFHKYFKTVFVDNYATVPHQSIERILALRRAGKLEILRLGNDCQIDPATEAPGVTVTYEAASRAFPAFIDATGQAASSALNLPFPTLLSQGLIRKAKTPTHRLVITDEPDEVVETGGIDLDLAFRPKFQDNLSNKLYCVAISFLLHKLPFVQGITSANEIGGIVARAILEDVSV
ncbi:hypothetical protein AEYBE204_10520 [Asticcacaulis sp. YBE204]|nr:hypothetical protein AEYBE204_10520 [Asticcacaulis sp. YBE204]